MKITAHIKPNSKGTLGVTRVQVDILDIRVGEPAINGRANRAAIIQLAKFFNVPKSKVRLLRGVTSKYKIFEIDNES